MSYLPDGSWIFFGNVPFEATAEDVQSYLAEAGIELTLDRIRMNKRAGDVRASATVSLSGDELASLVARAIHERELMGRRLRIRSANGSKTY
jgi:hypothetical protein